MKLTSKKAETLLKSSLKFLLRACKKYEVNFDKILKEEVKDEKR